MAKYNNEKSNGIYTCKFGHTTFPNQMISLIQIVVGLVFDDAIEGAVKRVADADGRQVEFLCTCEGHLGHDLSWWKNGLLFQDKNTRHCVNSISYKTRCKQRKKDENLSYAYALCRRLFLKLSTFLEKNGVKE